MTDVATEAPAQPYLKRLAAGDAPLVNKWIVAAIDSLTFPVDNERVRRLGFPTDAPLTVSQSCQVFGVRPRHLRAALKHPDGERRMASNVATLRSGAKGRAISKMIELIDDAGDGTAASRKVNLDASKALLGEDRAALSVNIHNNVANVKAGYIIRDTRPGYAFDVSPYERPRPPVIDARPVEPAPEPPSAVSEFIRKYSSLPDGPTGDSQRPDQRPASRAPIGTRLGD